MKDENKKKVIGIKELAVSVAEHESAIDSLVSKLDVIESDIEDKTYRCDFESLDARVDEIEDRVSNFEERIDRVDELKEKVEELENEHAVIEDVQQRVSTLNVKVQELETFIKLLLTRLPEDVLVSLVSEKFNLK